MGAHSITNSSSYFKTPLEKKKKQQQRKNKTFLGLFHRGRVIALARGSETHPISHPTASRAVAETKP